MNVTAIISEYNPMHRGHQFHIEQARKETDADYVIAVMSGNFVQRGVPAIADKYTRAAAALKSGIDLVIELPVSYATASAEYFALGGVATASALGVVKSLSFGSECGDVMRLMEAARILTEEPEDYRECLREELKNGRSFPAARIESFRRCAPGLSELLETPNNILGIEYCKALLKLKSTIKPHTIRRTGMGYHEEQVKSSGEAYASATGIRKLLSDHPPGYEEVLKSQCTPASFEHLSPYASYPPLTENDFSLLLRYKFILENRTDLCEYFGITKELASRIYRNLNSYENFSGFAECLKTKNITRTAINRALLHFLLDIKAEDVRDTTRRGCVDYIRVLGFRKTASRLVGAISHIPEIPLITNLSDAPVLCETDIRADQIYQTVFSGKYHVPYQNEYQRKMLVL